MRFYITTYVSKRDKNGNCYSYSIVTAKGCKVLRVNNGNQCSGGNIIAKLQRAGVTWAEMDSLEHLMPIREFQRNRKALADPVFEREVTTDMLLALER